MPAKRYDCSKCPGYCCSYPRIAVSDKDIERLAAHFGVDFATARERYTWRYQTREHDERCLRQKKDHVFRQVCRFFDTAARRCTVYAARPWVCRHYPHGSSCGYYEFLKFERVQQGDDDFIPSA